MAVGIARIVLDGNSQTGFHHSMLIKAEAKTIVHVVKHALRHNHC
jgi:hypothetical protein